MKYSALRRMLAALLTLMLLFAFALAEEIDYAAMVLSEENQESLYGFTDNDALLEEGALDASDAEPGDYEWYMLPAIPQDGCAYVDIYPAADVVFAADGSWQFAFTLEEVNGIAFQPYVLTIVCFAGRQEVRRDVTDSETMQLWWRDGGVLQRSAVTYEGSVADQDVTAVAISVIGLDADGCELEFHSIIDLTLLSL